MRDTEGQVKAFEVDLTPLVKGSGLYLKFIKSYLKSLVTEGELYKGSILAISKVFWDCCPDSAALRELKEATGREVIPPNLKELTHNVLSTWDLKTQGMFIKAMETLIIKNQKNLKVVKKLVIREPWLESFINLFRPGVKKKEELKDLLHAKYYGLIALISLYVFAGYVVKFKEQTWQK